MNNINDLQTQIMLFILDWVRSKKTPVPHREVILQMQADGVKTFTTINALNSLLKKGYIKKSDRMTTKTTYIQLRTI